MIFKLAVAAFARRIHDSGGGDGVVVARGARPRLEGCELFCNADGGIYVHEGGDPILSANIIRDHEGTLGMGVLVAADAAGLCTVLPDNVFLRNRGGNIVRDDPPCDEPDALSSPDISHFDHGAFLADLAKVGIGTLEALDYLVRLG